MAWVVERFQGAACTAAYGAGYVWGFVQALLGKV
jgi:hypothetical protein